MTGDVPGEREIRAYVFHSIPFGPPVITYARSRTTSGATARPIGRYWWGGGRRHRR